MSRADNRNPSLWWNLSWRLSLIFVAVVAVVTVGLSVYAAFTLNPYIGIKDNLAAALEGALHRDRQGRFVLEATAHLRAFQSENGKLWFVVATPQGETASFGAVPARYEGMSPYIRFIKDADIREDGNADEMAAVDTIDTSFGRVRVMYGGNTSASGNFLTMLIKLNPIYLPLLAITLPTLFLTVPRVVRHALEGLNAVVKKAPDIDPRHPGSRLPLEGVPKEVVPLILAFNRILERLEEQFQARGRFLIDAAHELRTPVAIMQARIEGMEPGRERRRLLDDVARLREMAEQLLDFENNTQTNHVFSTVDLVELSRSVVADLAPIAIGAGYEISFWSEVDRVERRGHPAALTRAISNLVRNAIDHGGGTGAISVAVSGLGDITVRDEGPGIPADHQKLVFEPFYRVLPRNTGAGLGLNLVKQIVANHHGEIGLESGPSGTCVTIALPEDPAAGASDHPS
ncbi:HAMP domain-containing sensor histidine kinase [Mesorhizobium abyssinicae]|uniref:sensor histidine kinase n=1 Tax=Mesorhizobium abyssinicae TaxID=1209958 RepID=UPI002A24356F|nr:HAMP domain-containing sensor histidine kinase [Mesorhizobium abyssinicae]MDX8437402.1 HAMP domain-containing sensor histidine kinase [Mesorhizobium abyssinicae]